MTWLWEGGCSGKEVQPPPHLASAYNRLGAFNAARGQIARTYGPWALISGWLLCYFPETHNSISSQTRFSPHFHPRMATYTKATFVTPSKLFWYSEHIKWRSYNLILDPSEREITDNTYASLLDFAYLVSCRPSILIYRNRQKIHAEIYRHARFGRQFEYQQHLPRVVNSESPTEVPLIKANKHWHECMRRLTLSVLVVPPSPLPLRYLSRNVTLAYARWWHKVAACATDHISGPSMMPKRKASTLSQEQSEDPGLFGSLPLGVERGGTTKSPRVRRKH